MQPYNPLYTQQLMNDYGTSWYKFDGNFIDSKGTKDGTNHGASFVTGWDGSGQAVSLNGTSDYISMASQFIPVGKKSIRFKMKTSENTSGGSAYVFNNGGPPTTSNLFIIYVNATTARLVCASYDGRGWSDHPYSVASANPVNDGVWHDVLFTYDGTLGVNSVKLYVDDMNTPVAMTTPTRTDPSSFSGNPYLGTSYNMGSTTFFNGQLDEIEIYNDVISPIAKKTLFKSSSGEILSYDNSNKKFVKINSETEQDYISYGLDDLTLLDETGVFTEKDYLMGNKSVFGSGTTFEQQVDYSKYKINNMSITGDASYKVLILDGTNYKYLDGTSWQTIGTSVVESDYTTYGMSDISTITHGQWLSLSTTNPIVKYYSANSNPIVPTLSVTTDPYSFDEEMGDSVDVMYYTDDVNKTSLEVDVVADYSPIDEINGNFDVVNWTDDTTQGLTKTASLSSLPIGQTVIPLNDINVYGSIKNIVLTRLNSANPIGKINTLISFNNGINWEAYRNNTWTLFDVSNISDFSVYGMDINELEAIPQSEFDKRTTNGTIRIAYYLDENIYETTDEAIDTTTINQNATFDTPTISNMSAYIINTVSTISMQLVGNNLTGTISDIDSGKVQYRVLLNNNNYYPADGSFTPLEPSPYNINITMNSSDYLIGQENSLVVEFQDYWGSTDSWSTTFIGTYHGLMFTDPQGNGYSTDFGEVLQYLNIGTLIAGQTSTVYEVHLKNDYSYSVANPTITSYVNQSQVSIEMSKTQSPFNAQDSLTWNQTLISGDELIFYVRLVTQLTTAPNSGGTFQLRVSADKA